MCLTFYEVFFHIFFHALRFATSSAFFLRIGYFFCFPLVDGTLIFIDIFILHGDIFFRFILLIFQVFFFLLLQNRQLFFGLLLSCSVFGESVIQLVDFLDMFEEVVFVNSVFILLGTFVFVLLRLFLGRVNL